MITTFKFKSRSVDSGAVFIFTQSISVRHSSSKAASKIPLSRKSACSRNISLIWVMTNREFAARGCHPLAVSLARDYNEPVVPVESRTRSAPLLCRTRIFSSPSPPGRRNPKRDLTKIVPIPDILTREALCNPVPAPMKIMFSKFLSILTCLAMLWHIIGGCCWHHEHRDCESTTTLSEAGLVVQSKGVCLHDHKAHHHHSDQPHHESEPPAPTPSHHGHHCEAGTCVYLKSFTPDLTSLLVSDVEFVTPVNELLNLQASGTLTKTDRVDLQTEALSALRRCALRQSWLL